MIGIDVVKISRMQMFVDCEPHLQKVFTPTELEYYKSKGEKLETLAGMYAAKEAVSKCFGTGLVGFRLTDIEVNHNENGMPIAKLYNGARRICGNKQVNISISHDGDIATAIAMLSARKGAVLL